MNRSLILAAVLATVGSAAMAQSTVTIYGRLNLSLEHQKNAAGMTNNKMQNSSSRWGIKGGEDLGGGMKAGFVVESGFDPSNGSANSPFWGRQSEVNLSGNFGMVRLGNFTSEAYYATSDYIGMHNHETGTSADAFYAYLGRDNSKIAYRLPELAKGLSIEMATAMKSGGGTGAKDTVDLAVNYDAGPMHLGAGYQKNDSANQFAFRGLYELGAFTVGGYIQRDKNVYGTGNRTTMRLSGMYAMGATELHLNVGRAGSYGTHVSGGAGDSANQYTVGINQNLSKRTKLYTFYTKIADDGTTYGGDFSSLAVGIRHNF